MKPDPTAELSAPTLGYHFAKNELKLVAINQLGKPAEPVGALPPDSALWLSMTAEHYGRVGFVPPWIGYIAVFEGEPVGTCAFKTAPQNDEVEIAYGVFESHRGRGHAKQMAATLVELAKRTQPAIRIFAQTLPEENPSTSVLKSVGFQFECPVNSPEDGLVWQWRYTP